VLLYATGGIRLSRVVALSEDGLCSKGMIWITPTNQKVASHKQQATSHKQQALQT